MKILLRHARAGERDEWEGDDRLRPPDEKGRRQAQRHDEPPLHLGEDERAGEQQRCPSAVDPVPPRDRGMRPGRELRHRLRELVGPERRADDLAQCACRAADRERGAGKRRRESGTDVLDLAPCRRASAQNLRTLFAASASLTSEISPCSSISRPRPTRTPSEWTVTNPLLSRRATSSRTVFDPTSTTPPVIAMGS